VLLPLALWRRQWRAVGLQLLALGVVFGPLMGFVWNSAAARGADLRLVTFNIGNSYRQGQHRVTPQELRRLFDVSRADILLVQECRFDSDALFAHFPDITVYSRSGSCALTRWPLTVIDRRDRTDMRALGGSGMVDRLEFQTPRGPISVVNVHLETVRQGMERVIARSFYAAAAMESNANVRRLESAVAVSWAARSELPLLVAGDFNMPSDSAIYRQYWSVLGNAFERCGRGYGYTKFERGYGIRIDHVLYDRHWDCVAATIDPSMGGDHRPLIVDLRLRQD
jgi:endonuclease/exonuclease/phosphatase family metal-dependent hydrolase